MAIEVKVPGMGESVTEVVLVEWLKEDGDFVKASEPICILETDKADVELPAPAAGILHRLKSGGEAVPVGETIASIEASAGEPKPEGEAKKEDLPAQEEEPVAAISADVRSEGETVPVGETTVSIEASAGEPKPEGEAKKERPPQGKEEAAISAGAESAQASLSPAVRRRVEKKPKPVEAASPRPPPAEARAAGQRPTEAVIPFDEEGVRRVPMSRIRLRIAERLVSAQQAAALLTTFNEIDMRTALDLRARYKDRFEEVHGVPLGIVSFFARASALSLQEFPRLNAFIEGEEVVYHQYVHLGVAVSTDRGLVVPVLRNVEKMSLAEMETEIKRVASAARAGTLSVENLSGGTFTITNGGIFGSLMSTPIVNPPQSGILGMHVIQKRPVAVEDRVEIRPMMYVALTYDHRLVDGREAVSFLVRIKELIEDPARMMLGV